MEKIKDHPTWKMLEESKQIFKEQVNAMPNWHPHKFLIEEFHSKLVSMQYKLEAKLVEQGFTND